MIKRVLKTESGMTMVFNQNGEQMPEYQGPWPEVKEKILRDAPPTALIVGETTLKYLDF